MCTRLASLRWVCTVHTGSTVLRQRTLQHEVLSADRQIECTDGAHTFCGEKQAARKTTKHQQAARSLRPWVMAYVLMWFDLHVKGETLPRVLRRFEAAVVRKMER